jgi:hypothetical protein
MKLSEINSDIDCRSLIEKCVYDYVNYSVFILIINDLTHKIETSDRPSWILKIQKVIDDVWYWGIKTLL